MTRTTPQLDSGAHETVHLYATGAAWSQLGDGPLRLLPGELPANLYADAYDATTAAGSLWGAAVKLRIVHGYPPAVVDATTGTPLYPALTARVLTWRARVLLDEMRADAARISA